MATKSTSLAEAAKPCGRAKGELRGFADNGIRGPMKSDLYRRAEAEQRRQSNGVRAKSEADPKRLLHELQVHQIELQMQNAELQHARDELEMSLEKYTDLYDFAPVGYFTLAPDGLVHLVNLTGAQLVGIERSRLVGLSFGLLISTELRPAFQSFLKQVFASQTRQAGDFEVLIKGRPSRAVNIEAQRSPNGFGCRVAVVDITERKRVEEKVRVSEIRYRRLFEAAHDGVLILDPGTRKITDSNPFMTKLLGYSHTQLVGKELFEIGLLKDETASQEMFQKLKRDREVRYENLPLESKSGRHQEVEVVANLYLENGHAVIQCNIRDITERKAATDALGASEERYRNLFNSMDEGYCIVEMIFDKRQKPVDYRFLEVNPAFEKQSGMHDVVGKRMREFVPEVEGQWLAKYGKVALTGEPIRFANEYKGLNRSFDVYAFRIGGNDSRKVAILFNNITERKQVEEALRQSEDRYRTLFTSIDEGFCIIESIFDKHDKPIDYRFLEVNPTFERQTGLLEAVGKRMRELVPDIESHWIEIYGQVALTGKSIRFMNEAKAMGGRWFDAYACRVGGAASRKVAIIFNDITQRKHTEQQLSEKARLLDLSHDAIIVRDMKGHIRYWNHGAEELYGWSRAEALGKISNLLLQTKYPIPLKQMTEELHRTDRWTGELVHVNRAGRRITVLGRKTLDRDSKGKPAAVLENLTDITARKRDQETQRRLAVMTASNQKLEREIVRRQAVEESLKQSEQLQMRLLKQSRLMQEQLRNVSRQVLQAQEEERKRISRELHDVIAQTLTGINIRLATLKKAAGRNTKDFDRNLTRTQWLVEKSVNLVHDFARELRPAVLDDLGLIAALHSFTKIFTAQTGIRVHLTASAEVEQLENSRRTVLFRIAQEALTNVGRHAQASRVEMSLQKLPHGICMKILDNGKSFNVARALQVTSGKRLGLLGMRERLEMVGGSFEIESTPGKGTTIMAQIPLDKVLRGGGGADGVR